MKPTAFKTDNGTWWPAWQIGNPPAGSGTFRILEYIGHETRLDAVARAAEIMEHGLFRPKISPESETINLEGNDTMPMSGKTPREMPRLDPGAFCWLLSCRDSLAQATAEQDGGDPRATFLRMLESRGSLDTVKAGIRELMFISHGLSLFSGWWHDKDTGAVVGSVPEKIALIHSELSEALEADRKGQMDDKLPHRPGVEVELADTLHRVLDLAGALNLDLAGAYVEKAIYNATRPDHDPENRAKPGGKKY